MKMTGAEIKAFYADWPIGDEWCHDDCLMEFDESSGQPVLDNATEYDFDDQIGYFEWHGKGKAPGHVVVNGVRVHVGGDEGIDTEALVKAWRGDAVVVSVRIEPSQLVRFREVCAEHGWKPIE